MAAKNEIWNSFTLNEETNHATCNRCGSSLKYSSRNGPNNLRHHLESFACKEHVTLSEEDAKLMNIVPPIRKPSPHEIWNHYVLIDNDLARCYRCGKLVTYRSVAGPGNLKAHLKTNGCKGMIKTKEEVVKEEEEPLLPQPPAAAAVVVVIPNVIVLPKADPLLFSTILNLLENIVVYDSKIRYNIPKHKSLHFGLVNRRDNFISYSVASRKYVSLYNELILLGKKICPIKFTTITVLKNTVTGKHKDKNNYGSTCIVSLGNYTGCKLIIEGKEYDARYQPLIFDGHRYEHWNTDDLVGDKYSLVYYSLKNDITNQIEVVEDEFSDMNHLSEMCEKESKKVRDDKINDIIALLQTVVEKIKDL